MLYTLSQANPNLDELRSLIALLTPNDAVLLWQDGVLQAVKNPSLFAKNENIFALAPDVTARAISLPSHIHPLSFEEWVTLTERFYPQVAL